MRVRAVLSALVAVAVSTVLAGCGFVTPIATQFPYDASDGISGTVGEVTIRNALVLTEDGSDGNLLFTAINDSDDDVTLALQYAVGAEKVTIQLELPAGSATNFGFGDAGQLLLAGIDTPAGDLFEVYFQYGSEPGVLLPLPVLDGTLEQYDPYLPMPVPTPTATETAAPAETAEETDSAEAETDGADTEQ